jgi:hypothetical protein
MSPHVIWMHWLMSIENCFICWVGSPCVCVGVVGLPPPLLLDSLVRVCGWFLIPFSCSPLELLLIRYSREIIWCCKSKSTMKHQQKSDWKLDLPWVNCDCRKNCMFVDFETNTYRSFQLCSLSSVKWFIKFENMVQCLLNITCVSIDLNCFFSWRLLLVGPLCFDW